MYSVRALRRAEQLCASTPRSWSRVTPRSKCCHEFKQETGLGADQCLSLDRGKDAFYRGGAALGGTWQGPAVRNSLPRRMIWTKAHQSRNSGDTH
jgi:hypothetical protein